MSEQVTRINLDEAMDYELAEFMAQSYDKILQMQSEIAITENNIIRIKQELAKRKQLREKAKSEQNGAEPIPKPTVPDPHQTPKTEKAL